MHPPLPARHHHAKPQYLYHGDRRLLEILEPRQGVGFGGDADCHTAVYAVAK